MSNQQLVLPTHEEIANAKPSHPLHAQALAMAGSKIGSYLITFALTAIVPFALQLAHLDPALAARFQEWDNGGGDARFEVGEIVHGFPVDKVKHAGVGVFFNRH